MADTDELRATLIDAAIVCAQATSASVQAAMVTAHIADAPDGKEAPTKNFADAGALASQAAQAASAVRDITAALSALPNDPPASPSA